MDSKSSKSVMGMSQLSRDLYSSFSVRRDSSITSDETSRSNKTTYSFMDKRNLYTIIENSNDVTPDNIIDNDFLMMTDHYHHAVFDSRIKRKSEGILKSSKSLNEAVDKGVKVYATTISLDDIYIDYTVNTLEGGLLDDSARLSLAPSAFYLPRKKPTMSYPSEFFLILKETETVYLYELPSYSYEKGTSEATTVEQENEFYQYITVGKGRNRKMVYEETQTQATITQSRHTLATRPQKKNAMTFASLWDMHDAYAQLAKETIVEEKDEMVMYQSIAPGLLRKTKAKMDLGGKGDSLSFEDLAKTQRFLNAVLLVERVLSTKEYANQQKKFRGLIKTDPLSLDLKYIYTLKPLWTFECKDIINRPITCIAFNPKNEDILAVGHGKFGYAETQNGLICIWCTKNPSNYERIFKFNDPLTSLSFSIMNPNWLACGFANGDVLILDVTSYEKRIIAKSKRETNPCFEPMWTTTWMTTENKQTEYVITTCQDGRINRFANTKTHDFICTPMMRICAVEGKLKGLEMAKSCVLDVPITRHPAALCIIWHPRIDHIYLVGTDEGCIHKCSTHYLNQHMEVFRAHTGPVYDMQFSPFMGHLLVSCGADNAIRLWIEGIDDVIMTLTCSSAVYGITFCPNNATILISISGNAISVWDLRRKTHIPCAEYTFPSSVILSYVSFTASGDNVIVADSLGKVHTFHLEDVPIAPFNQKKMLDDAIKKALCTRPKLLQQLEKLEKFRQSKT